MAAEKKKVSPNWECPKCGKKLGKCAKFAVTNGTCHFHPWCLKKSMRKEASRKIPYHVLQAILKGDKDALSRMGSAGGRAAAQAKKVTPKQKSLAERLLDQHMKHKDMQHSITEDGLDLFKGAAKLSKDDDASDRKLYYFEGRNTAIVARSEEEARKKKKRGGDKIVSVRTPTDSEKRMILADRWVRTRSDGKSPAKSELGKGRGYGPPRAEKSAQVKGIPQIHPTVKDVVGTLGGGENAEKMLMGITGAESLYGHHPNTYKQRSFGRGLFQFDRPGFDSTKDVKSHPNLTKHYKKIKDRWGIDWNKVTYDDMYDPLHSAIGARLRLLNVPEAIPKTREDRARYWKQYWNTYHPDAKGTPKKYLDRTVPGFSQNRIAKTTALS